MKKVMVFGTFDILHPGHQFFLNQAKQLGEILVVVVSRDATVKKLKGRAPFFTERSRLEHLRRLNIADCVRLGRLDDKLLVIVEERPDIIALGYDQTFFVPELKRRPETKKIPIIRFRAFKPSKFKSSKLIKSYATTGKNNFIRHH